MIVGVGLIIIILKWMKLVCIGRFGMSIKFLFKKIIIYLYNFKWNFYFILEKL